MNLNLQKFLYFQSQIQEEYRLIVSHKYYFIICTRTTMQIGFHGHFGESLLVSHFIQEFREFLIKYRVIVNCSTYPVLDRKIGHGCVR